MRKTSLVGLLSAMLLLAAVVALQPERRPSAAFDAETRTIGLVRDENGPVAGAKVRYKASPECTVTDQGGRFSLPPVAAFDLRVTAWKEGYYIGGAAIGPSTLDIPLKRLPCGDSERYSWIDPRPHPQDDRRCGNCHAEIYEEWRRSSHAGSATNPRFLNLYDGSDGEGHPRVGWSLQEEYPEGVGVCTNCHAPSVSLTDPAYFDVRQAQGTDALGVHCDFCHKIQNVNLPAPGLTHGRDGLTLLRPLHEPLFFGSLDDADQRADTYAPVYEQSLYCAPCHEGVVFGVHVYSTYSEWLVSRQAAARQHCQACHMPRCGTLRNIAPGRGGVPRDPATLASHADLGERADRLRRCLQIEVHAQRLSSGVTAHVTLGASGVGHQLPTGYIDRQLILLVQALDSRGVLVNLRDGSRLPAIIGSWAGQPGRLYAKQPQDFAGLSPAPFWRAQPALLDTRLAPDQSERATFVFDATAVSVRVQVVYRRFWEQVTRIKKWPVDDLTIFDEKLPVSPKH